VQKLIDLFREFSRTGFSRYSFINRNSASVGSMAFRSSTRHSIGHQFCDTLLTRGAVLISCQSSRVQSAASCLNPTKLLRTAKETGALVHSMRGLRRLKHLFRHMYVDCHTYNWI